MSMHRVAGWIIVAILVAGLAFAGAHSLARAGKAMSREAIASDLLARGDALNAALIHDDPVLAGVAWYRARRYERAAASFAQADSVIALYNQGVAIAHLALIEDAIRVFSAVLAQDPNHADARHNLAVLRSIDRAGEAESPENSAPQQGESVRQIQQSGDDSQMSAATEPMTRDEEQSAQADPSDDGQPDQQENVASLGGSGRSNTRDNARIDDQAGEGDANAENVDQPTDSDPAETESGGMLRDAAESEAELAEAIRLRHLVDDPALVLKARLAAAARIRAENAR